MSTKLIESNPTDLFNIWLLTNNPTCQEVAVHPTSQIFVCNEPLTPLEKQCSQKSPSSDVRREPLTLVVLYGTYSLWLYMYELYALPLYM